MRLLPNSASARFPDGLANSSGLVGKNLMFHPHARIAGWFDQMLDPYSGPAELHMEPGTLRDGPRPRVRARLHLGILSRPPRLSQAFLPPHRHGGDLRGPAGGAQQRDPRPVLKDSNGIPAPRITYQLSENSCRILDHAVERGSEIRNGWIADLRCNGSG